MGRRRYRTNYRYYAKDWGTETAAQEARDNEAAMRNSHGWITQTSEGDGFFSVAARHPEDTEAPLDDFGELYQVHPSKQSENGFTLVVCTPILSPEEAKLRDDEALRALARIIFQPPGKDQGQGE